MIGLETDNPDNMKILQAIRIVIINEKSNSIVTRFTPKKLSNKNSYTIEENSKYRICAQRSRMQAFSKKKLFLKMNIESENSEEKNLDKALKNADLNPVTEKIRTIITKSQSIVEAQKQETDIEDAFSSMQMSYTWNFVIFACVQILGVVAVGIYHIYSFRKFLVNNNILE